MNTSIKKISSVKKDENILIIASNYKHIDKTFLSTSELSHISKKHKDDDKNFFHFNHLENHVFVCITPEKEEDKEYLAKEKCRKLGNKVAKICKTEKIENLTVISGKAEKEDVIDVIEGILLSNYKFDKYIGESKKTKLLKTINLHECKLDKKEIDELLLKTKSVFIARNWVNEPGSSLTPELFVEDVKKLFSDLPSVKLEVFSEKKIASLKMSGIEAVSKGGPNKPAFIILEYIPEEFKNQKPYVLVGKGIFFDTGGMNLKPGSSMSDMKCDMSGGATVASTIYLLASMKINVPVVGLIPATENRIGNIAYLPGDILKMMNGVTVEIKNTDAEGRLILADALCYAKRYDPLLTITIATLTGSAHSTFGYHAIAGMQNKASNYFSLLKSSSFEVYERIAELPMWEEYEKLIESSVADIQNVGGKYAGAITAAKFLQEFTDYPFIHLDIAGPAFLEKANGYIPEGGSGVGVRLFYNFLNKLKS